MLIADNNQEHRSFLLNALLAQFATVTVVTSGREAYDALQKNAADTDSRRYDFAFITLSFVDSSIPFDDYSGLQAINMIKADSATAGYPIVAMSEKRTVPGAASKALAAGAVMYVLLPSLVDLNVDVSVSAMRLETPEGTTTSFDLNAKKDIKKIYGAKVKRVLDFFTVRSSDVSITAVIETISIPPAEIAADLPGTTVGHTITIVGTIEQVNHAFVGVYYYAPAYTNGVVNLTISVTDKAAECVLPQLTVNPLFETQPAAFSVVTLSAGPTVYSLCDTAQSNTVSANIPITVAAVNQPPTIIYTSLAFTAKLSANILVPTIAVEDLDHDDEVLTSSTGEVVAAKMTVTVSCISGRVSFIVQSGITFTGTGTSDRATTLQGSMVNVNNALGSMFYACYAADACVVGTEDQIAIVADDQGYSGGGGSKYAYLTLNVTVVA